LAQLKIKKDLLKDIYFESVLESKKEKNNNKEKKNK